MIDTFRIIPILHSGGYLTLSHISCCYTMLLPDYIPVS